MTGEGAVLVRLLVCFLALRLMWGWDNVRGRRRDRLARNVGRIDRDTGRWVEYLRGYQVLEALTSKDAIGI